MHESLDLPFGAVDLEEYRRRRVTADLYRRTLWGAVFCALGCAITSWVGGYFQHALGLTMSVLLAFGMLAWMRWAHRPPQDLTDVAANRRWTQHHWWMVLATSLVWSGFLLAVGMIEQRATITFFVAAMVTVAFTSASAESLALNRAQALAAVSLQQLPALSILWVAAPELRAINVVLMAFWLYQALHIGRRAKEYDAQMNIEHTLLRSRAEIEQLSRQDGLTGLANRRHYEMTFELHWNLAARDRGNLALLVLDLDHFKRINDQFGHSVGDACLKHVAGLLKQEFKRARDVVARIGGEEFVVILPDMSAADATRTGHQLCARMAETPLMFEGRRIHVTGSFGVGSMNWEIDRTPQMSFSRIDAACYAAKAQGRNQVVQA